MEKITLPSVSKELAQEIIRSMEDRGKVLGKILSTCLVAGQVDAAGEVKKGIDALQKFSGDVQERIQKLN